MVVKEGRWADCIVSEVVVSAAWVAVVAAAAVRVVEVGTSAVVAVAVRVVEVDTLAVVVVAVRVVEVDTFVAVAVLEQKAAVEAVAPIVGTGDASQPKVFEQHHLNHPCHH